MKLKCGQIFAVKETSDLVLLVGTPIVTDMYCTLAFDSTASLAIVKRENLLNNFVYIGDL